MNWINRTFVLTYSKKSEERKWKKERIWPSVILSVICLLPTLLPLFINQLPSDTIIFHITLFLGSVSPIFVIIFGAYLQQFTLTQFQLFQKGWKNLKVNFNLGRFSILLKIGNIIG